MLCKPIFSALAPFIVLPLAACSPSQPASQPKKGTAPKAKTVAVKAAAFQPKPTTASHTRPKPGELKTFTDWTVGCDNTLRCTLASLLPEMGGEDMITLNLLREPGPVAGDGGRISLVLETINDVEATKLPPVSFAVDGKRIALHDATALAAAIANAQSLKILDAKGGTLATLSLKGAAAALRYIDAQQGRACSIDAVVAKGPAPSRAPYRRCRSSPRSLPPAPPKTQQCPGSNDAQTRYLRSRQLSLTGLVSQSPLPKRTPSAVASRWSSFLARPAPTT